MQRNYRIYFTYLSLVMLLGLFVSACITKKPPPDKSGPPPKILSKVPENTRTVSAIYSLESRFKNLKSLNAKASVDINMPDLNQDVNSQIRWIRDSVLWMNFTVLGIEGARLLITKDSFFMVDRINKRFMAENLAQMAAKYNLPISFKTMQNFLLGNPVFLSNSDIQLEKSNQLNHFIQEDKVWKGDYYTDPGTSQLNKLNLRQKTGDATMSQHLENYKALKNSSDFSFDRLIEFYSKASGKASIKLVIKDLGINARKEIKFSIPSSYERM